MCYTTCNEAALQVLTEGKLITWGQRQFIYRKNYQHFNTYIYMLYQSHVPHPFQGLFYCV